MLMRSLGFQWKGILRARGKAARLFEALGKGEELVDGVNV